MSHSHRTSCSLCGSEDLEECFSLPDTPLANEFVKKPRPQEMFPVTLVICEGCGHLQSGILVSPDRLFSDYVYASSTSPTTIAHLRDQARTIDAALGLRQEKSFVVEIGSNDGSLLQQFADIGIPKAHLLGIEPAAKLARSASNKDLRTLIGFFSEGFAKDFRETYIAPDVVVANNVLAHVPDVRDALYGVKKLVGDTGVLVMDVAHAADLLHGAWDTIYHEHLSHHAFTPLLSALQEVGLPVFDVDLMSSQVGRGSLRVWAGCSRVRTSEAARKIEELMMIERQKKLTSPATWHILRSMIVNERYQVWRSMRDWQGKEIWGYGAPAKMTTLVHTYGMDHLPVKKVADDSPLKQGLLTPGTHWPVVPVEELIAANPDLVIVFAWNFADDIRRKLKEKGYEGTIVTPQELARGEA